MDHCTKHMQSEPIAQSPFVECRLTVSRTFLPSLRECLAAATHTITMYILYHVYKLYITIVYWRCQSEICLFIDLQNQVEVHIVNERIAI